MTTKGRTTLAIAAVIAVGALTPAAAFAECPNESGSGAPQGASNQQQPAAQSGNGQSSNASSANRRRHRRPRQNSQNGEQGQGQQPPQGRLPA